MEEETHCEKKKQLVNEIVALLKNGAELYHPYSLVK